MKDFRQMVLRVYHVSAVPPLNIQSWPWQHSTNKLQVMCFDANTAGDTVAFWTSMLGEMQQRATWSPHPRSLNPNPDGHSL